MDTDDIFVKLNVLRQIISPEIKYRILHIQCTYFLAPLFPYGGVGMHSYTLSCIPLFVFCLFCKKWHSHGLSHIMNSRVRCDLFAGLIFFVTMAVKPSLVKALLAVTFTGLGAGSTHCSLLSTPDVNWQDVT